MKPEPKEPKIPYRYVGIPKRSRPPGELEALRYLKDTVGARKCPGCGYYALPGRMCPTEGCKEGE